MFISGATLAFNETTYSTSEAGPLEVDVCVQISDLTGELQSNLIVTLSDLPGTLTGMRITDTAVPVGELHMLICL